MLSRHWQRYLQCPQAQERAYTSREGVSSYALGLILLIWCLLEHAMRTHLEEGDTTVPGWENKPTRRPTAYRVSWKFKGVLVLCVGQQRYLAKPLSAVQQAFLDALQVPQSRFTHCPRTG
jgi:hypothetical protein